MYSSRRAAACVVVGLLVSCGVASAQPGSQPETEQQRVLAAEDRYVIAELSRNEAMLRELVDDRFVMNANDGTTSGKEALIRTVLGMNMSGQKLTERSVIIEAGFALIFGTTELRFGTGASTDRVSVMRYTSTYVKRDGEWRMLALHMVPRAQP